MTNGQSELLNPPHHQIVKTNPAASYVLGKIVELPSRVNARGLEDKVTYGTLWNMGLSGTDLGSCQSFSRDHGRAI